MVQPPPGSVGPSPAAAAGEGGAVSPVQAAQQFLQAFQKTIKSASLYSRTSELMTRFQDNTFTLYQMLTTTHGDVELAIRADRFLLGRDVVLQDMDREAGLPFRLYREGVRKLTFMAGMDAAELLELEGIFSSSARGMDEDVVTRLWRASLPHVRYVTIDISSAAYTKAADGQDPEEADQDAAIRQELDALLSAIYQGGRKNDGGGVKGLSIGADDLLALKALGGQHQAEAEVLGHQTGRAIFTVPDKVLQRLRHEVEQEQEAALTDRTLDVLLAVLFAVRTGAETKKVMDQLCAVFDALLLSRDFRGAAGMVDRVRRYAQTDARATDPAVLKNLAIVKQLMKVFGSEQRLASLALAVNDMQTAPTADLARLWSAMGQDQPASLLPMLSSIQNPQHRRLLCDVVATLGVPPAAQIEAHLTGGEWFVARDILYLLGKSPEPAAARLVLGMCGHPHPRLRQAALSMLGQGHPKGEADARVLAALRDEDAQVRQTAVRMANARGLKDAYPTLAEQVLAPDFAGRELGEIKSTLMACAMLGGESAVPLLDELLNPPLLQKGAALLDKLRGSVEAAADSQKVDLRMAAAAALGAVKSPLALASLQKGARSVIPAVKAAAQKILEQTQGSAAGAATVVQPRKP